MYEISLTQRNKSNFITLCTPFCTLQKGVQPFQTVLPLPLNIQKHQTRMEQEITFNDVPAILGTINQRLSRIERTIQPPAQGKQPRKMMSLKDFIQAYLEGVVHTRTCYLDAVSQALPENPTHAYLLLILQIKRYYPDLGERYYEIMQEEVALWKKVLTDAVASGEIGPQQDLDTVAATFQSLFYGYSFHAAVGKAFDPAALQAQMMGFYRSLCK